MLKTDRYLDSILFRKLTAVETSEDVTNVPQPAAARPEASAKRERVWPPVVLDNKRAVGIDTRRCSLVSCA
jgi:hypothetical protein